MRIDCVAKKVFSDCYLYINLLHRYLRRLNRVSVIYSSQVLTYLKLSTIIYLKRDEKVNGPIQVSRYYARTKYVYVIFGCTIQLTTRFVCNLGDAGSDMPAPGVLFSLYQCFQIHGWSPKMAKIWY